MDWWTYYRALVVQAWHEGISVMGWPKQPWPLISLTVLVWLLTMGVYSRMDSASSVSSQFKFFLAGCVALIWAAITLSLFSLILAPYSLAKKADQQLGAAQRTIEGQRETLQDRSRLQEKADDYAEFIHSGKKITVRWSDAVLKKNEPGMLEESQNALKWLESLRPKLQDDFGVAVAEHFALGEPADTKIPMGESQRREHQARVKTLDELVQKMRAGELHMRVRDPKS